MILVSARLSFDFPSPERLQELNHATCGTAAKNAPYRLVMTCEVQKRDYRSWKLEQLALATAYLLGPHEAMLAGETSLLDSHITDGPVKWDLAVSVTRPTSWSLASILSMGNSDGSRWQVIRPT
jgi:hypothetical protein